jgi:hypothetical protein
MEKYTPTKLIEARENPFVIKWRASNRNGTIIEKPTVQEMRDMSKYSKACEQYVATMLRSIISQEKKLYQCLDLKCESYYKNRYDVTAVENRILRNEIRLKHLTN